ncbi:MAG: 4Fe-4S binding protein [Acidobacteriota bacterium]|nr:4Fe-4S binding protein [Acidobacteriota bacterium]
MASNTHVENKQRRQFRLRLAAFLVLHALIGLHLLAWYVWDWRVIGAIDMQELFRNWIEKNILTAGAVFFLFFLGTTMLWGRFFCGWLCHIGQVYDLSAVGFRKLGIKLRPFPLRFGPVVAGGILIYYFVLEAVQNRGQAGETPLVVDMGLTEPWELLPGWVNGTITLLVVLVALPLFLGPRAFCRNLCPWGVMLGAVNRWSAFKVRRTGDCTMCGACSTACPMDIDVSRDINTTLSVDRLDCTNCLQCVAACPKDALSFSPPGKTARYKQTEPFLPALQLPPLHHELFFWLMTCTVGFIYAELYGMGIFLAFCMGLLLARLSWALGPRLRGRGVVRATATGLLLLFLWGVVAKDGVAGHQYNAGLTAMADGRFDHAAAHFERSDRLFWVSPDFLLLNLNQVYLRTGQEEKRKENAARFNERQRQRGRL